MRKATWYTLLAAILSCTAFAEFDNCHWELDPNDPYENEVFRDHIIPDTYVAYFRYRFKLTANSRMKLRIRGRLPNARYSSFALYDQSTRNEVSFLHDKEITTNKEGEYIISMVDPRDVEGGNELVRKKSPNEESALDLWYRVYFPKDPNDLAGGVPLPELRGIDVFGEEVDCPAKYSPPAVPTGKPKLPPSTKDITFFRTRANSFYRNNDNSYGIAKLNFNPETHVALIDFKPPAVDKQVRYWSMCLAGFSGETGGCIADMDAFTHSDGNVHLAIAENGFEKEIRARGYNFIPRGKLFGMLLLYRNLLPDEKFKELLKGPYAPKGTYVSKKDFLALEKVAVPDALGKGFHQLPREHKSVVPKEPTARFGVSVSFFLGKLWSNVIQETNTDLDYISNLLGVAEKYLSERFLEKTGLRARIEVLNPDILAQRIASGDLDFAFFMGDEFPWVQKSWPEVEPVFWGNFTSIQSPEIQSYLITRPEFLDEYRIKEGEGTVKFLKKLQDRYNGELRLAVGPIRPTSMYALYHHFLLNDVNPELFFSKADESEVKNVHEVILNTIGFSEKKGAFKINADLAVVDEDAIRSLGSVYGKGVTDRVKIFAKLPPAPGPLVAYNPRKIQRSVEKAFEPLMMKKAVSGKDKVMKDLLAHVTQRLFGFGYLNLIDRKYWDAMTKYKKSLSVAPEFFLPVQMLKSTEDWKVVE